jgi:hypothetical protein
VIHFDKNPPYPAAVEAPKMEGTSRAAFTCASAGTSISLIEHDHRTVTRRVWLAKGYGSFATPWRTKQST